MFKFENADIKHSEREVTGFIKEYTNTIHKACSSTPLDEADWGVVVSDVALKYACGKLEFDASKKASMNTFVYTVARNEALNVWKSYKSNHFIATDPVVLGGKKDSSFSEGGAPSEAGEDNQPQIVFEESMSREDCWLRINEALNRLSAECRNPGRIAIFIRHVFFQEPRNVVARKFKVSANTVSVTKSRLLPRLRRHLKTIAEEEAKGLYSKRGSKVFIRRENFPF